MLQIPFLIAFPMYKWYNHTIIHLICYTEVDSLDILDTRAKTPLYLELYRKLCQEIESGKYAVGEKLPSEKEIAEQNNVSRITSKHAMEQLVSEGYVRRFAGRGTFVSSLSGSAVLAETAEESAAPAAQKASKLIGVIMEGMSNDFGAEILMGIEQKCAELDYSAVVKFTYGNEEREAACINELLEAGVSGIVLMCVYDEVYSPVVMKLALDGFPLVFLDRSLKGLAVPFVGTNHLEASRQITGKLLERGHTSLALALFDESHNTSSAEERVVGYVESCLTHNLLCGSKRISLKREDIHRPKPEERARNVQIIREFFNQNPDTTACLALSARVACILLEALSKVENRVQLVAAFDGPRNCIQTPCEFVYVEQDQFLMGKTACTRLVDAVEKREVPMVTYIPHQLIP